MYRLNIFFIPLVTASLVFSCAPRGPLTPADAFHGVKVACRDKDAPALTRLLSEKSVKKVRFAVDIFKGMGDRQLKSLSRAYGVSPLILKKLTIKDYISLTMDSKGWNNVISEAVAHNVIGIRENGSTAIIKVENGMELKFVKEGPYWKLELDDL